MTGRRDGRSLYGRLVHVTFSQLRVLQAVARTGNLTRAAGELGTTQPAVSHALRSLERELGVTLLLRHSNGVSLTPVGRAVRHRAGLILGQLEGLSQEAAAARGRAQGRLRLGVVPSVNARLMPGVLKLFAGTHADVELSVLEGSDAEVLEWLQTGAIDVATVTALASGLATTVVASDQMVAVVPADHRLASRARVAVGDLAREPFIMSSGGCEPLISDLAHRAGVTLRCHYRVRDTNSILTMVAEHLGVTLLPELSLPADAAGFSAVPLHPSEVRTIRLAVLADATPDPAATAFVELAARELAATRDASNGARRRRHREAGGTAAVPHLTGGT
jgi:DNA-binding transcriptional LysR family regulator